MPADVTSMFSVREMPWHQQGYVPDRYPTDFTEARQWAGLEWDAVAAPVFEPDPEVPGTFREIDGWQRIVHSGTGEKIWLTPESYEIITIRDMGEIVTALLDQTGVRYETAGALQNSRSVWFLMRLDEPIVLAGSQAVDDSPTFPYVALTNRFDQQGSCAARATSVRIVCANTYRAAEMESDRAGTTYSFRHTRNWRDRIEEAKATITGARREFAAYAEMFGHLLDLRVTIPQTERFIAEFVPMPPEGVISDRVAANVQRDRQKIRDLLGGKTVAPVAHTAYGLVMAAGEYADHLRGYRNRETYLRRTLLRPEPLKRHAYDLALEVAKG